MKQKRRRRNKKRQKKFLSNAGNNSQLASIPPCVQDAVGFADLNYLYFVGGYKEPEDKMDERTILKVREVWRYNPICSEWALLPIRLATTSSIARSRRPSQPPHRYFGSRDGVAPISTTSVGSASPLNNHTGPGFIYSLMVGETNRKQLRMVYLEADRFIDTPIVQGEPDCEDCDDCCDYYGYSFNISSSICKQGDAYPTEFYQKEVITVDHKYPYKSQIQFYKLCMNEAGEWRRSHVVAPDVSWNEPFKAKVRQDYDRWMINDAQKKLTASENPKAPAIDVYLQWIVDAWEIPEAIAKSFKDCGITICHDGSEDNQVHFFEEHGAIPDGFYELRNVRDSVRQPRNDAEETDANQDDENGYLTDESLHFKEPLEVDWTYELNPPNPQFHAF